MILTFGRFRKKFLWRNLPTFNKKKNVFIQNPVFNTSFRRFEKHNIASSDPRPEYYRQMKSKSIWVFFPPFLPTSRHRKHLSQLAQNQNTEGLGYRREALRKPSA